MPLVFGPPRELRAVAAYPRAVYLTDGSRWVSLVTPGALLPPDGLHLEAQDDLSVRVPPGAIVRIGRGRLELPSGSALVATPATRLWLPVVRPGNRPRRCSMQLAAALLCDLPPQPPVADPFALRVTPRLHTLYGAVLRSLSQERMDEAIQHVVTLAGLGPGLTPLGDDVLAGMLLALSLLAPYLPENWLSYRYDLAVAAAARTTGRSASWLQLAGNGAFARPFLVFGRALQRCDRRHAPALLRHVLATGSTSGWGVAYGLLTTYRELGPLVGLE